MKKFRSFGGTEETRISSQRTDKTRRLFLFRPIQAGPDFFREIFGRPPKKIRQPRHCREQQRERERGVPPHPVRSHHHPVRSPHRRRRRGYLVPAAR